jgi:SAM-dependent methyltransferase
MARAASGDGYGGRRANPGWDAMISTATRERIRSSTPWWAKCALKLALVPLPVGYDALRALSLARHGGMMRPAFAYEAFRRHFDSADFRHKSGGFTVLELGPGDSLAAAVIAKALGASRTCHVDVGPFATGDVMVYKATALLLAEQGLKPPDLSAARSLGDVMAACSARYETGGLASLRALPEASFDFVFSNGVLQSVRRAEFAETMDQLRRVLHPGGVSVHSIDLRDTMGQSLHHLRFPEGVWESRWFRSAGFYTNRLRYSELMDSFRRAGFEPEPSEVNRWDRLPLPRNSLARRYRGLPDDDLLIATARVVLRPAG